MQSICSLFKNKQIFDLLCADAAIHHQSHRGSVGAGLLRYARKAENYSKLS